jgi:hypothetical protein
MSYISSDKNRIAILNATYSYQQNTSVASTTPKSYDSINKLLFQGETYTNDGVYTYNNTTIGNNKYLYMDSGALVFKNWSHRWTVGTGLVTTGTSQGIKNSSPVQLRSYYDSNSPYSIAYYALQGNYISQSIFNKINTDNSILFAPPNLLAPSDIMSISNTVPSSSGGFTLVATSNLKIFRLIQDINI